MHLKWLGQSSTPRQCSCGVAVQLGPNWAYNQEAFHHLLTLERERCRRWGRHFLLLLVDAEATSGGSLPWEPWLARRLFWTLSRCLRESDFVGWYVDHRIAGAVLTELGEEPRADVAGLVAGRVNNALRPVGQLLFAGRLRVRVSLDPEHLSGGLLCSG
jgi:hypothetical protein